MKSTLLLVALALWAAQPAQAAPEASVLLDGLGDVDLPEPSDPVEPMPQGGGGEDICTPYLIVEGEKVPPEQCVPMPLYWIFPEGIPP